MSAYLLGLAWKVDLKTTNRKVVLMRLVDAAEDDGTSIYPSVARISADTHVGKRTVQKILSEFVCEELLIIVGHEHGGRGKARHYRLSLAKLHQLTAGTKGAGIAPIVDAKEKGADADTKRVHPETQKGATALHPTPYNPSINPSKSAREDFWEKFCAAYPNLGSRQAAKSEFEHAVKSGADPKAIVNAAIGAAHLWQTKGTEQRYIPHARRWLVEKQFNDHELDSNRALQKRYVLHKGTAIWDAYLAHLQANGKRTTFIETQEVWAVPVDTWPADIAPSDEVVEMAS